MIISISGKAGSGKDTVGKIIQYLENPKATTESITKAVLIGNRTFKSSSWQIKKYSDKLKDMVCILIGCTREELEDQQFKAAPLGEEWWSYCYANGTYLVPYDGKGDNTYLSKLTPRSILQSLGTDFGRDMLHPNVWVNALFADYKSDCPIEKHGPYGHLECGCDLSCNKKDGGCEKPYPNWIITDSRFPNDVKRTHEMGGILIRVNRAECEGRTNEHISETALDDFNEWDYVIENNGTIEELIEQVRTILEEAGIIAVP